MQIDDAAMKTLVAKAIFDGITPAQREQLLSDAIQKLLTEEKENGYGGKTKPSPLSNLFEYEVQNLAREAVRERFQNDPNLKSMLGDVITKAIAAMANDSNLATEIGNCIATAFARANRRDNY